MVAHFDHLFECPFCDAKYTQNGNLKTHEKQYHAPIEDPKATCYVCPGFQHHTHNNADDIRTCNWCEQEFINNPTRRRHSRLCEKNPHNLIRNNIEPEYDFQRGQMHIKKRILFWPYYNNRVYLNKVGNPEVMIPDTSDTPGEPEIRVQGHEGTWFVFNNYIALRSAILGYTNLVFTGMYSKIHVEYYHLLNKLSREGRVFRLNDEIDPEWQCKQDVIAEWNKYIKSEIPDDWPEKWRYHPDAMEQGHSVEWRMGGSCLLCCIWPQGCRNNRSVCAGIEMLGRKSLDAGFKRYCFATGCFVKSQIPLECLRNNNPDGKTYAIVGGKQHEVPFAFFRMYLCEDANDDLTLFSFLHENFGLTSETMPDLKGKFPAQCTFEELWLGHNKYCANADTICDWLRERLFTQEVKDRIKYQNEYNGIRAPERVLLQ